MTDAMQVKEALRPHKTMTLDEYIAEPRLKGWHSVCFDVDGFGGVGVRYHGEVAPTPAVLDPVTAEADARKAIEFAVTEISDDFERFEFLQCFLLGKSRQWPKFKTAAPLPATQGDGE